MSLKDKISRFGSNRILSHIIDIIFGLFTLLLSIYYYFLISPLKLPIWDAGAYLANAHGWLSNLYLLEPFRPPLLSWIIAGIWTITGENWETVKFMPAFFAVCSGLILYFALKRHKGPLFAFAVTALTMLNTQVIGFSTQIVTESLSLFFLVLTLFFIKSDKATHWFLAGVTIGLTFASRYPIVIQSFIIVLVEFLFIRKNFTLASRAILGLLLVSGITVTVVYLKTGTFQTALEKDTQLSIRNFETPFYIENSINIWGFAFLLVPVALLFRRTYTDSYNYTFLSWFAVSLLFWSANSNTDFRFTIQFMPAVYFLAILGVENIIHYLKEIHLVLKTQRTQL